MAIPVDFKNRYSLNGETYQKENVDAALSNLFTVLSRLYNENGELRISCANAVAERDAIRDEAEALRSELDTLRTVPPCDTSDTELVTGKKLTDVLEMLVDINDRLDSISGEDVIIRKSVEVIGAKIDALGGMPSVGHNTWDDDTIESVKNARMYDEQVLSEQDALEGGEETSGAANITEDELPTEPNRSDDSTGTDSIVAELQRAITMTSAIDKATEGEPEGEPAEEPADETEGKSSEATVVLIDTATVKDAAEAAEEAAEDVVEDAVDDAAGEETEEKAEEATVVLIDTATVKDAAEAAEEAAEDVVEDAVDDAVGEETEEKAEEATVVLIDTATVKDAAEAAEEAAEDVVEDVVEDTVDDAAGEEPEEKPEETTVVLIDTATVKANDEAADETIEEAAEEAKTESTAEPEETDGSEESVKADTDATGSTESDDDITADSASDTTTDAASDALFNRDEILKKVGIGEEPEPIEPSKPISDDNIQRMLREMFASNAEPTPDSNVHQSESESAPETEPEAGIEPENTAPSNSGFVIDLPSDTGVKQTDSAPSASTVGDQKSEIPNFDEVKNSLEAIRRRMGQSKK